MNQTTKIECESCKIILTKRYIKKHRKTNKHIKNYSAIMIQKIYRGYQCRTEKNTDTEQFFRLLEQLHLFDEEITKLFFEQIREEKEEEPNIFRLEQLKEEIKKQFKLRNDFREKYNEDIKLEIRNKIKLLQKELLQKQKENDDEERREENEIYEREQEEIIRKEQEELIKRKKIECKSCKITLTKKHLKRHKKSHKHSSIVIQKIFRGYLVRKQIVIRNEEVRNEEEEEQEPIKTRKKIECKSCKITLTKKHFNRHKKSQKHSSIVIQKIFRGYQVRK
jgi:hypothetical protein